MSNFDISLIKDLVGFDCSQEDWNQCISTNPQLCDLMKKMSAMTEGMSKGQRIELLKNMLPIVSNLNDFSMKSLEAGVEQSKSSVDAEKNIFELIGKILENENLSQESKEVFLKKLLEMASQEQNHRHKNEDADREVNRSINKFWMYACAIFLLGYGGCWVKKKLD